jgi:predicted DCC family thiol-disulfide oxidoreductase YuxK
MKPLLIYDGECGFCLEWIARWRAATGDRVDYAPYQEAAGQFPDIPRERFAEAVQLREPDGRWSSGAEAVFRALSYAPGRGWPLALYRRLPGFAWLAEHSYRWVAGHRPALLRLTRWILGKRDAS